MDQPVQEAPWKEQDREKKGILFKKRIIQGRNLFIIESLGLRLIVYLFSHLGCGFVGLNKHSKLNWISVHIFVHLGDMRNILDYWEC